MAALARHTRAPSRLPTTAAIPTKRKTRRKAGFLHRKFDEGRRFRVTTADANP
jgi:hypothetical protein